MSNEKEHREACEHVRQLHAKVAEVEAELDAANELIDELAGVQQLREAAEARAERAERDRDNIREAWSEANAELQRIKAAADAISGDDYWGWLGDGDDDLEGMGDAMQIRITAGCLRGLLDDRYTKATKEAASIADKMATRHEAQPGDDASRSCAIAARIIERVIRKAGAHRPKAGKL